jgi:hypothetical protein
MRPVTLHLTFRVGDLISWAERPGSAETRRLGIVIMSNSKKQEYCLICKRLLDNPEDPLSRNCGGDCWGCVGAIEAEMGWEDSLACVRKECEAGLRPGWIDPFKP